MIAVAEEGFVVAGSAQILAVSHIFIVHELARIATGAVRVAVLAARNEVVTLLDNHGRLRTSCNCVFVVLDGLSDETGTSLDALDKLLVGILGRGDGAVANVHNEVDVVLLLDISALSTASDQLFTLLALESIAYINISIHAPTSPSASIIIPTIVGIALRAFAVDVDSGNVRVANLARASFLALLAVRVVRALTLHADLLAVQVVAFDAASALVGRAGRTLIIDIVAASLAAAIVKSVALSTGKALAILALFTDDSGTVGIAITAFTIENGVANLAGGT